MDPEELKGLTTPPPSHLYDDWKDWETWEASPDIAKSFPYYRSGYDKNGLVGTSKDPATDLKACLPEFKFVLAVYVVEFGKWDYRDLATKSEERIKEFWKYFEKYV